MTKNVTDPGLRVVDTDGIDDETATSRLPDQVQLALADIADSAREGLLALSVTTGFAVLGEMMEQERTELCGPIHAKNADREFERGGTTPTSVVLGGRKLPFQRPRVQANGRFGRGRARHVPGRVER